VADRSDVFAAVASPVRRALLGLLLDRGPLPVQQLAAHFAMSRPSVSEHLKVLKDAGLVAERAVGTRRIYRLNEAAVAALRDQLDTFWTRALSGFQDLVERPPEEKS